MCSWARICARGNVTVIKLGSMASAPTESLKATAKRSGWSREQQCGRCQVVHDSDSLNTPMDATTARKRRIRAVLIALLGVLSVSPDAMLLRSMHELGASPADVAAAKFCGVFILMVALGVVRGAHRAWLAPRHFVAAACFQVMNQLCTTFSLLLTTAARALLLLSLTPMWAALLGKLFLGEPLHLRTRVSLVLSILAALTMFAPWLLPTQLSVQNPFQAKFLVGDALATVAGVVQAGFLIVNRHAALHWPKSDLTLATCVSSLGKSPRTTSKSFRMHHLWVARSPAHVCLCCSLQLPSPSS